MGVICFLRADNPGDLDHREAFLMGITYLLFQLTKDSTPLWNGLVNSVGAFLKSIFKSIFMMEVSNEIIWTLLTRSPFIPA